MTSSTTLLDHDFADGFTGDVIEPDSPDYDDARRTALASGSPAVVLRPANVTDVRTAVAFAARTGLALSVRGGGHGFPGFGTNDGGVVIDLGRMSGTEVVDHQRHLVRIGGGATWGPVADVLATHGLAISSGDTRTVGVGGLTLSGGIGWKVRKHGLALDSLVAAEVVTPGGDIVRASAEENPELFWALRGGGGSFGIVTAFEFRAHRTTDVFHGRIAFAAAEASDVLRGWADLLSTAPDELTSTLELANPFTGGPESPVEVAVVYDGDDPQRAAEAIDPIRRLGRVVHDDVALTPYAATLAEGMVLPPGLRIVTRNGFVDATAVPAVVSILTDVAAAKGSPFLGVRSLGGAVARVPDDATAYAHRQAELVVVTTIGGPAPVVEAAVPTLEAVWARLAPHVNGAYANFLSSATDSDVASIYPTDTRARLAEVKRRYDPENLFRANHNVRPGSTVQARA